MFWALLAAGVIVALLGVPFGDDDDTMDALQELTAFQRNFDRKKLEATLLSLASAQGLVGLDQVARAVAGPAAPQVVAAPSAKPIEPDAGVALASLQQIHALSRRGSTLEIGTASADELGLALGWRLSRRAGVERFELRSIALGGGACSSADVERERAVADARKAMLQSTGDAEAAQKRFDDAEGLSEQRRKWKAPWKSILKADEKREEARTALKQAQQTLAKNSKHYESLAKKAESAKPAADAPRRSGAKASDCTIAAAAVRELPSGKDFELRLPTPVARRAVPVPPLTGVEFPVMHASGLWDELEQSSVAAAIERLRGRFSWHYQGRLVLQLAPLALLPFFLGLMRRTRGVGALYNPFDRVSFDSLPRVGLGSGFLNLIVLVLLPLAACLLCAWSLIQLNEPPIVPALCAMACVGLGGICHVKVGELLELRDAITRSHSNPPPATSAS
jgi:hypothetical protein